MKLSKQMALAIVAGSVMAMSSPSVVWADTGSGSGGETTGSGTGVDARARAAQRRAERQTQRLSKRMHAQLRRDMQDFKHDMKDFRHAVRDELMLMAESGATAEALTAAADARLLEVEPMVLAAQTALDAKVAGMKTTLAEREADEKWARKVDRMAAKVAESFEKTADHAADFIEAALAEALEYLAAPEDGSIGDDGDDDDGVDDGGDDGSGDGGADDGAGIDPVP